jgi:hypothetical protein
MKKYFLLVAILALASCQDAYLENEVRSTVSHSVYDSAEQDAIQIASSAAAVFFDQSRSVRTITSAKAVTPIYSSSYSRVEGEEPIIYAVDYDDNQGFAIISAKNTTDQLLGVFESGSYEEAMENRSFEYYIESASNYVQLGVILGDTIPEPYALQIRENTSKAKSPKIKVRWGQGYPYGMYCPNKVAGCSNTAMAQIMSYYKYPTTLELTYEGAASDSIMLDWDVILKHKKSTSNNESDTTCCGSSKAHIMIASLLRELGNRAYSDYTADNSTVTFNFVLQQVLTDLGYTVSSSSSYYAGVEYDTLDSGLLLTIGNDKRDETGHTWVVDGYRFISMFMVDKKTGAIVKALNSSPHYAHVNWGWNGSGNGYYLSNVFDTDNPLMLDLGCSSTSNGYYSVDVRYYLVSH